MARHFIRVVDATGYIDGDLEYDGPDADKAPLPEAPTGHSFVELTGDPAWKGLGSLVCTVRQKDGSFVTPAPTEMRIGVDRFYDLFTYAQRSATFDLEATDPQVRDLVRRVNTGQPINMMSPRVALGLTLLKSKGVFGVDATVANAEIARILRNELP